MGKSNRIKGVKNIKKIKRVGNTTLSKEEVEAKVGEIFADTVMLYIEKDFKENILVFETELKHNLGLYMKYIKYGGLKSDFGHWHDLVMNVEIK